MSVNSQEKEKVTYQGTGYTVETRSDAEKTVGNQRVMVRIFFLHPDKLLGAFKKDRTVTFDIKTGIVVEDEEALLGG